MAMQSTPLLDRNGEPIGILSTHFRAPRHFSEHELRITDLYTQQAAVATERTRAQTSLRESEERLRRVVNIEGVGVLQFDMTGTLIGANDSFLAVTGYDREEVEGKRLTWRDLTPPESVAEIEAQMWGLADSGRAGPNEKEYVRADGSRSWMLVADADLGNGAIIEYCVDVSDRKRTEAALLESEASFQRQIDESTTGLRTLSRRLLAMQEDERHRISRELYDEIGQLLTGLQLQLVSAGRANDTDRGAVLSLASGIVRELTSRVSELSMDLRPAALDTLGLLPSLLWHIERYQATTGVPVDFRHEGLARRFPAAVEITGYRVVQEGLTNVARHAQASTATIQLLADDRTMTVMIRIPVRGSNWAGSPPRAC